MLRDIETRWACAKPKSMLENWGIQPCIHLTICYGEQHNIIKGEIYNCTPHWFSMIISVIFDEKALFLTKSMEISNPHKNLKNTYDIPCECPPHIPVELVFPTLPHNPNVLPTLLVPPITLEHHFHSLNLILPMCFHLLMTTLMMTYLKIHLIVYRQSYSTSLSIIFFPSPIYLYYKGENYHLYINYVANFAQWFRTSKLMNQP